MAIDGQAGLRAVSRRPGANVLDADPDEVARILGEVLQEVALEGPDEVAGIVVGLAGLLARPESEADVLRLVAARGYPTEPLVVNDAEAMFASGSVGRDGYVLAAGTGAIAMAVRAERAVAVVDGHGSLFGDDGSAVWIGIAAVKAALRALDGRGASTTLTTEVPRFLASTVGRPCPADPRVIVRLARGLARRELGQLATIVGREAEQGDPVCRSILRSAVGALSETLSAAVQRGGGEETLPIVLGGSVVHENAIVRDELVGAIQSLWPHAPLSWVRSGAAGAALWARRRAGRDYDDETRSTLVREVENRQY